MCLDSGDVAFTREDNGLKFVYRIKPDGSGMQKFFPTPVVDVAAMDPDGNWLATDVKSGDGILGRMMIYNVHNGIGKQICDICAPMWSPDSKRLYVSFALVAKRDSKDRGQTYVIPWKPGSNLEALPPGGTRTEADVARGRSNDCRLRAKLKSLLQSVPTSTPIADVRFSAISTGFLCPSPPLQDTRACECLAVENLAGSGCRCRPRSCACRLQRFPHPLERCRPRHPHPERKPRPSTRSCIEARALTYLTARHSISANDRPDHLPLPDRRKTRGGGWVSSTKPRT